MGAAGAAGGGALPSSSSNVASEDVSDFAINEFNDLAVAVAVAVAVDVVLDTFRS